ncbi:MAG: IPT/TIG domain-containing protein [Gammaproteobacteria bacterium]
MTLAVGVPLVADKGIVNGASFSRDTVVSPGSLASLFGVNLAARAEAAVSVPLPTTLGGTQVLVNDMAAPLFFVSPTQINFQVPAEVAGTSMIVVVASGNDLSPPATTPVAPQGPGIFTAAASGAGQAAVLNQDGSANSAQNPAAAGSVLQIFATGLGATNPPAATGQPGALSPPFNVTVQQPIVLVGGSAADVEFSALAPGFVGLYQVNARIPAATAAGNSVTLQVQMGGRNSNLVTIAVR